jgi:hypothetical protein
LRVPLWPPKLERGQALVDHGFEIVDRWKRHYQFRGKLPRLVERKDDYQFALDALRLVQQKPNG